MTPIQQAAERLRTAEQLKTACAPIRSLIGDTSVEDAYGVQFINTHHRVQQGARIVGKKIGLTSKKVQAQLGVDQPDFGVLFDDMQIVNGGTLTFSALMQPKAEAEIAFVLKKSLPQVDCTLEEVAAAIDYAVAAIEIVGSRIADWDIKITDTIADNASASHFVLGTVQKSIETIDLIACEMQLFHNGVLASEGSGAACLGSPLIATHWLAQKMARLNLPLDAGDIILSGALGPMVQLKPGDRLLATVEGLGQVTVEID